MLCDSTHSVEWLWQKPYSAHYETLNLKHDFRSCYFSGKKKLHNVSFIMHNLSYKCSVTSMSPVGWCWKYQHFTVTHGILVQGKEEKVENQDCHESLMHSLCPSSTLFLNLFILCVIWICCDRISSRIRRPVHQFEFSWTFQVPVSVYLQSGETGFIGKRLMSQEVVVEIESSSNKPDCRIQLLY